MSSYGSPESIQAIGTLDFPCFINPNDIELYDSQLDSYLDLNGYFDLGLDPFDGAASFPGSHGRHYDRQSREASAEIEPSDYGTSSGLSHSEVERAAWSDLDTVHRLQNMQLPALQPFGPSMFDQTLGGVGSWMADGGESVRAAMSTPPRQPESHKHTCRECPLSFTTAIKLEEHAKKWKHLCYVCPEIGCNKRYCRRDVYFRHLANHKDSGIHTCPVCLECNERKTFRRKDHLDQHVRNRHPDSSFRYDTHEAYTMSRQVSTSGLDGNDFLSTEMQWQPSSRNDAQPLKTYNVASHSQGGIAAKDPGSQSRTVQEITSALSSILADNRIAIQMIEQSLDGCDPSMQEEFALSLADLALAEPNKLPLQTKVQLQQTSANRSPRLNTYIQA